MLLSSETIIFSAVLGIVAYHYVGKIRVPGDNITCYRSHSQTPVYEQFCAIYSNVRTGSSQDLDIAYYRPNMEGDQFKLYFENHARLRQVAGTSMIANLRRFQIICARSFLMFTSSGPPPSPSLMKLLPPHHLTQLTLLPFEIG